jgi:arsenate reductase (thioredoxin)
MTPVTKRKVLFVCIHNSARSQMAEELLRQIASDRFETESAGLEPGNLNPFAVEVLKEKGIDITLKKTKKVADLAAAGKRYDFVITVCDEGNAGRCPTFPGGTKLHWGFPDPSTLKGDHEHKLARTRAIRDEIEKTICAWLDTTP